MYMYEQKHESLTIKSSLSSSSSSKHASQYVIAHVNSNRPHPVSALSWWMWVFASQPTVVCPCVVVHWRVSLMSSSLLPQQFRACLVSLNCMICVMDSKWPYNCFFVVCLEITALLTFSGKYSLLLILSSLYLWKYQNIYMYIYLYIYIERESCIWIIIVKVGDCGRGLPEGSLFNSYYTEM